ncbi:spermatogenesis-associated protein 20 [Lates japonicus]|uniref:Spermatogenesis-associated protein 20 n=1 Tax=Lates japonicus TaxID=270547 RepID=A0AAD3MW53_LATJO|nr:spermatogenesis-associated protein 20 [Lates japonicus]
MAKVLMLIDSDENFLCQRQPVLSSMSQQGGVATAYVCQDFTCSLPVTDPQELRRLLLDWTMEMGTE